MGTNFSMPVENALAHHGIKGQKWGVRRFQNEDGSLTEAGKRRYATVFVSGSSKTQTEDSPYRRDELPKAVQDELNRHMSLNSNFVVGDAPGIDRQVQDYLNRANYSNVSVYGPGTAVRYQANKNWKTHPIDAPEYEVGSKEWLAAKDIAMEKVSTEGLAVVLDEGAKATRKNVERLVQNGKTVMVYELNKNGADYDRWINDGKLKHSDYLMHHGIKGQKWGVRRFQNEDGSLTAAGKARYVTGGTLRSTIKKVSEMRARHAEKKKAKVIAKGSAKQVEKYIPKLTTNELREALTRIELAKQVRDYRVVNNADKLYQPIMTLSRVFNNVSTITNSLAAAREGALRVRAAFEGEEEAAEKKGRLKGIEDAAKIKAQDEKYPSGYARNKKKDEKDKKTREQQLSERVKSLMNKSVDDRVKETSTSASRGNAKIKDMPDYDPSTKGYTPPRKYQSPAIKSASSGSKPLDMTSLAAKKFVADRLYIELKQRKKLREHSSTGESNESSSRPSTSSSSSSFTPSVPKDITKMLNEYRERRNTSSSSNWKSSDVEDLAKSLLSSNQIKLDEYEKKKLKHEDLDMGDYLEHHGIFNRWGDMNLDEIKELQKASRRS